MGHGSSVSTGSFNYLFCDPEIIDGSRYVHDDELFRVAFVDFARHSTWSEYLGRFIPNENRLVISLDMLAREKLCLINEYVVPRAVVDKLYSSSALKNNNAEESTLRTKYSQEESTPGADEKMSAVGFTSEHLTCILFTILYPIYIASVDLEDLHGNMSVNSELEIALRANNILPTTLSDHAKRARDVLLGPAQLCTQEDMHTALSKPTFPLSVLQAVDAHKMAITIVDSQTETFPIVYANAAFTALSGYTVSELVQRKRNLLVLSGPESETSQLALLHEATAKGQSAKLALTCHKRSKHSFLNLIAMRSVGRYSVAIHTAVNKDLDFAALPAVDDVLMLLSLVIRRNSQCSTANTANSNKRSMFAGSNSGPTSPTGRYAHHPGFTSPLVCSSSDSTDIMPALQLRVRPDGGVSQYHEGDVWPQVHHAHASHLGEEGGLSRCDEGENESADPSSKNAPHKLSAEDMTHTAEISREQSSLHLSSMH